MNNINNTKRKIILGTDWWTDCDDVAAVRVAAWAEKQNIWEIKGIIINACMEYSAPSLNAFMIHEGIGHVPIGIDLEATDFGGKPPYQEYMIRYPHVILKNEDCESGVSLYRRLLSEEPDGSVEIVEIGYPQVLAALLNSPPDEYSESDGLTLTRRKVKKLWMMAGNWENNGRGFENNITRSPRSRKGAAEIFEKWTSPVCLLGWEVGAPVIIGGERIKNSEDDMMAQAFMAHGSSDGRSAWDPMLVLLAADNDFAKSGYAVHYGKASVNPETGENIFEYSENGPHCYVEKKLSRAEYTTRLNNIL